MSETRKTITPNQIDFTTTLADDDLFIIYKSNKFYSLNFSQLKNLVGNIKDIVENFSNISMSGSPRIIQVSSDETNDNEPTLYWWDGQNLNWIPSQNT